MMNGLLNKLERKFGKYAINNLSLYIIIAYVIGYVLMLTGSLEFISLNPYYIFEKYQVWRVLTWVLVPPSRFDIFTIIMLYFYYQIGTTLERTWGAFRYNIYIFSGIVFSVIGAFLLYFLYLGIGQGADATTVGYLVSTGFSTYYINLSIFLAFAAVYPDMQVLLFFVIPIKMKWLAYVDAALIAYSFIASGTADRIAIVMSLLNFIIFFFGSFNYKRVSPGEIYRRQQFKKAVRQANASRTQGDYKGYAGQKSSATFTGITKHKCAICGRTEKDSDSLEFRFCSKCNGNYEYCNAHLFTHEHKV